MGNMSQSVPENLTFGLPPLAEPTRIVARVEPLLRLCEALESRLRVAQSERGRLVETVLVGVDGFSRIRTGLYITLAVRMFYRHHYPGAGLLR